MNPFFFQLSFNALGSTASEDTFLLLFISLSSVLAFYHSTHNSTLLQLEANVDFLYAFWKVPRQQGEVHVWQKEDESVGWFVCGNLHMECTMLRVFSDTSLYKHTWRKGVRCEEQQKVPTVRPSSENGLSSLPVHTYPKFAGEVLVWLGQSWRLAASKLRLEIIVQRALKTL